MLRRLLLWRRWTGRKSPSSGMKSPNKQLLVWFSSFSRSELWLRLCHLPIIPGVQETLIMLCHTHSRGNWCLSSICLLFVCIFKLIHAFRMFLLCCFMQCRDLICISHCKMRLSYALSNGDEFMWMEYNHITWLIFSIDLHILIALVKKQISFTSMFDDFLKFLGYLT